MCVCVCVCRQTLRLFDTLAAASTAEGQHTGYVTLTSEPMTFEPVGSSKCNKLWHRFTEVLFDSIQREVLPMTWVLNYFRFA